MSEPSLRDWWEELFQVYEFQQYQAYADDLTRREVDFVVQALQLIGVESLLDLACGGGRHVLELARRGYQVEGVDAAAPVIAYATSRAEEQGLSARFGVGDMRQLTYSGKFDAVLLMNSSLGFFDDDTNRAVLAGVAQSLAPGGRLLLQMINPYQIEAYLQSFRSGWYKLGQGYVLREARFAPRSASLLIDYRYIDPQQQLDVTHPGDHIRLYGFPEITALLRDVGLLPRAVFGDAILPLVEFEESSQWQVVVAEKRVAVEKSIE